MPGIVPIRFSLGRLAISLALATAPAIAAAEPDLFDEFGTLDTSGNGLVTPAEFQAHLGNSFDEIDAAADGQLTAGEIKASEARFKRYVTTKPVDVDQDGLVSRSEYAAAVALKFKAMDANGDGELGFMEFEP